MSEVKCRKCGQYYDRDEMAEGGTATICNYCLEAEEDELDEKWAHEYGEHGENLHDDGDYDEDIYDEEDDE